MSEEAVVDVPVAPVAAVVPATAETPEPPAVETPPAPPTAEELQKKFDRDAAMQRRRYEKDLQAEREARIRLEERLAQHAPARPADPGMPTIDKFDNFDDYVTAKAEYIASKKIESTLSEHEKRQAAEKAKAAQEQTVEGWNKRVAAADIPDFHDVLAASDVPMTSVMQQAIMESENGPKLAYHLATNPADAERIAGMTPIGAVRALTLIEEGLKKPVAVSKATPPITPVGSKATSIKSLLDVKDYDEFSKRRAAQIAKRR